MGGKSKWKLWLLQCLQIFENESQFSRGRLRNNGAQDVYNIFGPDATIFFTDVDVIATLSFMRRCQILTIQSKSVYFPVLWSEKKSDPMSNVEYDIRNDNLYLDFDFHDPTQVSFGAVQLEKTTESKTLVDIENSTKENF